MDVLGREHTTEDRRFLVFDSCRGTLQQNIVDWKLWLESPFHYYGTEHMPQEQDHNTCGSSLAQLLQIMWSSEHNQLLLDLVLFRCSSWPRSSALQFSKTQWSADSGGGKGMDGCISS
jgi:hypothetical protein